MKKNNKGITLIALVITIVILIILAGVAINLTLGENGILKKAENAREEYKMAQAKEKLELEILEVQTKIMEEQSRIATLEDLFTLIDTSKYEIVLKYEPLASSEIVQTKATYAEVIEIESKIEFIVDNKLKIREVTLEVKEESELIGEFEINIANENGEYFTIDASGANTTDGSTIAGYKYYIDGEKVKETTKNTCTVKDLELNTEYKVKVVATDKNGAEKSSKVKTITTQSKMYLYKEGNQYEEITGGWTAEAIGCGNSATVVAPTLTFESNHMNISLAQKSVMSGGSVVLNKDIDYSKYSKICYKYTGTLGIYSGASSVQVFKNSKNVQTYPANTLNPSDLNGYDILIYTSAITTPTVKEFDLTQIENIEDLYIFIQVQANQGATNCQIYEVWLEK